MTISPRLYFLNFYDFLNLSEGLFQLKIQFMIDILMSILFSTGGPLCLSTVDIHHHNVTMTLNNFISSKYKAVSTTFCKCVGVERFKSSRNVTKP